MGVLIGLLTMPACAFDPGGASINRGDVDAAVEVDGMPGPADAMVDPCTTWTYVPHHFNPCVIDDPGGALSLNTPDSDQNAFPYYLYDTTTGVLLDPMGNSINHENQLLTQTPQIRLISAESLLVNTNTTLRVVGDHPLLVAAWGDIAVNGTIDASSKADFDDEIPTLQQVGAGANQAECATSNRTGGDGVTGDAVTGKGSGGGGGGFGAAGGFGGQTDSGAGGLAGQATDGVPGELLGGCPGGTGGDGRNHDIRPGSGGAGGSGGGVVHLAAKDGFSMATSGRLHAGGAGGFPGDDDHGGDTHRVGGGGGGSGGLLAIEGATITIAANAVLAANGGAGGAGVNSADGTPGEDGPLTDTPASGGAGDYNGDGGDGGDGGALASPTGQFASPVTDNDGGGGGGGGAGVIIVYNTDGADVNINGGAVFSPALTTP